MIVVKWLAGILGGIAMGVLMAVIYSLSVPPGMWTFGLLIAFGLGVLFALLIAGTAPGAGKAWRRVLIALSLVSFALPLSGIVFTARTATTVADAASKRGELAQAGAMAGGVLAGGIATGIMAVAGAFLGVIFLVLGLVTGRDKQIVYIHGPPPDIL